MAVGGWVMTTEGLPIDDSCRLVSVFVVGDWCAGFAFLSIVLPSSTMKGGIGSWLLSNA